MTRYRLYLAGADASSDATAAEGEKLKALCAAAGIEGLSPLDAEDADIRRGRVDQIDAADAVLADIAPFREPLMARVLAFELGYATALSKPVILWSSAGAGDGVEGLSRSERAMIMSSDAVIWPGAEAAIAEAVRRSGPHAAETSAEVQEAAEDARAKHARINRQLQRETRRSVVIGFGIAMAVAFAASALVNHLVGW